MENQYYNHYNPARWDSPCAAPVSQEVSFAPSRSKKRSLKGVVIGLSILVVLLAAALGLVLWNGAQDTVSFWGGSSSGNSDDYDYYSYYEDSGLEEAETTIEPGPTTGSLALTLTDPTEELSLQGIYQKVIPSIVIITAMNGDSGGQGTGVIISEDGYIVTNHHIISGEATATVTLGDGTVYPATLVGSDAESDLAVLKIDASGLTPAEFGNSDLLQVGDTILAIGNPLGEDFFGSMTQGIVSSINREVYMDGYTMSLIQHTAAINSGSSGGALVNIYGQVVGITNMKMSSSYNTVEGLGFAIPTVWAKEIVDVLLSDGAILNRPTIGITCYELDEETADENGMVAGIYVASVRAKSDAFEQGLQVGDIIVAVNGVESLNMEIFTQIRDELGIGGLLHTTVWRNGEYLDITFAIMDQCDLD